MFGLLDASWIFYAAIGGVALIGADALYLTVHHATDHRRRVNRRLARLDGVAGREQASIQLKRERGLDGRHGRAGPGSLTRVSVATRPVRCRIRRHQLVW